MLACPITDGPHETPQLLTEGIPFISVDAIHDGIIDLSKMRGYISKFDDEKYCKKYSPAIDDVYFTKAATIGRVAIVKQLGFNIWSPIGAIRSDKEQLMPRYLFQVLQTEKIQNNAIMESNSGSQYNLSMDKIEDFNIPLPTNLKEQKYISSLFESIDNLITLHQRECNG